MSLGCPLLAPALTEHIIVIFIAIVETVKESYIASKNRFGLDPFLYKYSLEPSS